MFRISLFKKSVFYLTIHQLNTQTGFRDRSGKLLKGAVLTYTTGISAINLSKRKQQKILKLLRGTHEMTDKSD